MADIDAAQRLLNGPLTVLDVIGALDAAGFHDVAANVLEMQRQRVIGDYLQPAAIFDRDSRSAARSTIPTTTAARAPATGSTASAGRRCRICRRRGSRATGSSRSAASQAGCLAGGCRASRARTSAMEVVIALGPAFGSALTRTIGGLDHRDVLRAIDRRDCSDEGVPARLVRDLPHVGLRRSSATPAAQLSGSGIAIGLQSKGTTVIHRRDLVPLENLELFAQAPNMDLETYRRIGAMPRCYAHGKPRRRCRCAVDNTARLRLIVQTTLLHRERDAAGAARQGAGGTALGRRPAGSLQS